MPNPARDTTAGRVYNDLRNLARRTGRSTDEVMVDYVLERFLYRMSISPLGGRHFVLKGGLLLAQFGARRMTRDIDILGRAFSGEEPEIISRIFLRISAIACLPQGDVSTPRGQTHPEPSSRRGTQDDLVVVISEEGDKGQCFGDHTHLVAVCGQQRGGVVAAGGVHGEGTVRR